MKLSSSFVVPPTFSKTLLSPGRKSFAHSKQQDSKNTKGFDSHTIRTPVLIIRESVQGGARPDVSDRTITWILNSEIAYH